MSASSPINQQSVAFCFAEVEEDEYGGITVDMKEESVDAEVYVPMLQALLSDWKQQGKKSVWIKLPRHLSNLIAPTLKEGFGYHHAEPDYLMLVRWLPETPDALPGNGSHTVCIGAFVMNDENEATALTAATRASSPFFVSPVNIPPGDYLYYTTSGAISSGDIPLISMPLQEYIPMDATVVSADSLRQATHLLLSLKVEIVNQTGKLANSLEELRRSYAVTQEENAALRRRLEEAQRREGHKDLPDDGDESKGST